MEQIEDYDDLTTDKLQELLIRTEVIQNSVTVMGLEAKNIDELTEMERACRQVSNSVSEVLEERLTPEEMRALQEEIPSPNEDSILTR